MFFRRLHNNSLSSLIAVPILVILLWMRLFVMPQSSFSTINNPAMPLWSNYLEPWFASSQFVAALTSLLLIFLSGFALNKIVNKNILLSSQSMITLLIFSLLISSFVSVQKLNPQLFFLFFLVHSINRLMVDVNSKKVELRNLFDASFLIGVGSFIYLKGIFFFPAILIMMGILRVLNLRTFFISVIGFALPFFFSFTYLFYTDQLSMFIEDFSENILSNPGQYNHTMFSQSFMAAIILFLVMSLISIFRRLPSKKVNVRLYYRIFIWLLLYTTALLLTPFFSMEILPIAAISSSVLLASLFENTRKPLLRELLFVLFAGLIIVGQFYLV